MCLPSCAKQVGPKKSKTFDWPIVLYSLLAPFLLLYIFFYNQKQPNVMPAQLRAACVIQFWIVR